MGTVEEIDAATAVPEGFDPMVPLDAMGLQIIGCKPLDPSDHANKVYQANVVLRGCVLKPAAPPLWLKRGTIDSWARSGQSSSRYVFVKPSQRRRNV
jgi:hypothetical protein